MTETSARWNKKYYDDEMFQYCCSNCNGITIYKYPFCPWCGAKMDTEGNT